MAEAPISDQEIAKMQRARKYQRFAARCFVLRLLNEPLPFPNHFGQKRFEARISCRASFLKAPLSSATTGNKLWYGGKRPRRHAHHAGGANGEPVSAVGPRPTRDDVTCGLAARSASCSPRTRRGGWLRTSPCCQCFASHYPERRPKLLAAA